MGDLTGEHMRKVYAIKNDADTIFASYSEDERDKFFCGELADAVACNPKLAKIDCLLDVETVAENGKARLSTLEKLVLFGGPVFPPLDFVPYGKQSPPDSAKSKIPFPVGSRVVEAENNNSGIVIGVDGEKRNVEIDRFAEGAGLLIPTQYLTPEEFHPYPAGSRAIVISGEYQGRTGTVKKSHNTLLRSIHLDGEAEDFRFMCEVKVLNSYEMDPDNPPPPVDFPVGSRVQLSVKGAFPHIRLGYVRDVAEPAGTRGVEFEDRHGEPLIYVAKTILQSAPECEPTLRVGAAPLALDVDMESVRAMHRVWRGLNDGDCAKCHSFHPATAIIREQNRITCPSCNFSISLAEIEDLQKAFRPAMDRALEIFLNWRKEREVVARCIFPVDSRVRIRQMHQLAGRHGVVTEVSGETRCVQLDYIGSKVAEGKIRLSVDKLEPAHLPPPELHYQKPAPGHRGTEDLPRVAAIPRFNPGDKVERIADGKSGVVDNVHPRLPHDSIVSYKVTWSTGELEEYVPQNSLVIQP